MSAGQAGTIYSALAEDGITWGAYTFLKTLPIVMYRIPRKFSWPFIFFQIDVIHIILVLKIKSSPEKSPQNPSENTAIFGIRTIDNFWKKNSMQKTGKRTSRSPFSNQPLHVARTQHLRHYIKILSTFGVRIMNTKKEETGWVSYIGSIRITIFWDYLSKMLEDENYRFKRPDWEWNTRPERQSIEWIKSISRASWRFCATCWHLVTSLDQYTIYLFIFDWCLHICLIRLCFQDLIDFPAQHFNKSKVNTSHTYWRRTRYRTASVTRKWESGKDLEDLEDLKDN